jgi:hypothetical protein
MDEVVHVGGAALTPLEKVVPVNPDYFGAFRT